MKILVTPTSLQPGKNEEALKKLQDFAQEIVFNPYGRPLKEEELIALLDGCDGFVAGLDMITDKVLSSCPDLKVVSRYGAGYDRVDLESAKRNQVIVTNTPGVNAEAVGELAFSLALALARKITYLNNNTRDGGWIRSTGMELKGKTLGILGLGAIGKVVARCGQGFEMNVIAYDPYISEEYCRANNIESKTFEEVIKEANVISLHLPLLETTKHLIDDKCFSMMQDNCILINTSRGGIIDEEAAYEALKSGKLGGLGLDAFEVEPPKSSKLFEFDNVVATPHTGAHTKEATRNMAELSIDNLIRVLSGHKCNYIISK